MVALATIPQLLNEFFPQSTVKNIIYNIYTPVEFLLCYQLFKKKLHKKQLQKVFSYLTAIYIVSSVLIIVNFNLNKTFISEWVCLTNLIYTIWILLILIEEYQRETVAIHARQPFFWYMLGIFLYAPCTAMIFSIWHYLQENKDSALQNLYLIHGVFNISMYILFAIGIFQENKPRPHQTQEHPLSNFQ